MHKRLLTSLGLLAVMATIAVPSLTQAHGKKMPRMSDPVAIDSKGDASAIGRYNSEVKNHKRKVVSGTVTAVSASSITVQVGSGVTNTNTVSNTNTTTNTSTRVKTYTFAIDSLTKVIRKYKGSATINEVMIGDKVQVWGTSLTGGTAKLIWDKSIWYSEVKGVVSNLNTTGMAFTLTVTIKGVEYSTTVKMDSATSYLASDGTTKAITDLANGQTVKVRGAWNALGKYLLAKRIVIMS